MGQILIEVLVLIDAIIAGAHISIAALSKIT
jgi:hypothetical protein